jgi:hypothetical protein
LCFIDAKLKIVYSMTKGDHMKRHLLLLPCLLLCFSAGAQAAQDGQNCEAKSRQVKIDKRKAFLKSCLAQVGSPANVKEAVQQNKRATCEQNARNMKLAGTKRSDYLNGCMNKNEAAVVAKKVEAQAAARSQAAKARKPAKPAAGNVSCSQKAKQQGLQGEARKKFIRDCSKG